MPATMIPFRAARQARVALVVAVLALGIAALGSGTIVAPAQTSAATVTATAAADACPPATPTTSVESSGLCVAIGEYDIYYKPNLVTIPADTPVRVVLVNNGEATHNFSITDHENTGLHNLNVSLTNDSGKSDETTINAPEGMYYFFCYQPGHEQAGMRGYLTVKKNAAITTADATVTPRAG